MTKDQIEYNETVHSNTREIEKLKKNFPQYFDKEGNFLFDEFKDMIQNEDIKLEKEGFELKFLGKNYAKYLSGTNSTTVLTPDVNHNKKENNKNSENVYIIGDNLDAIKHLSNSYSNQIKCIYIDPPYNTGKDDFVYPDNFKFTKESLSEILGIELEESERILNMTGKSTHSAWLTFMYPRLLLARDLLSDSGVIYISIDDNEVSNLKLICDEVFGEGNKIAILPTIMNLKGNQDEFGFAGTHEYTLVYSKDKAKTVIKDFIVPDSEILIWEQDEEGFYKEGASLKSTGGNAPREKRPNLFFPVYITKEGKFSIEKTSDEDTEILPITKGKEMSWRWQKSTMLEKINDIIVKETGDSYSIYKKQRPSIGDLPSKKPKSIFYKPEYSSGTGTSQIKSLFKNIKVFENPKPIDLLKDFFSLSTSKDENDIVLDFFSGSATTAQAIMQLNAKDEGNRKYILVQLDEKIKEDKLAYKEGYRTIDEIGRTRIEKAAEVIETETKAEIDYGFKLYKINDINEKTLDKITRFDPNQTLFSKDDMLESLKFDDNSPIETILTTWSNMDGYGLNTEINLINLNGYKSYLVEDSLYIIEKGITSDDVQNLIYKIENRIIDISRIVVYPYSIEFNIIHELKKNILNLRNGNKVSLVERY